MKSELCNLYAYYRPSDTIDAVEHLKILFDSVHNFFLCFCANYLFKCTYTQKKK